MKIRLLVVMTILSLGISASGGDIPRVILHQGYLTDGSGNPVNGSVNISFGIYDVESGGNPLLEEDVGSVTIRDGFYALEIGKNVNLYSLFADKYSLYLEVRINNEALTPRQRIGSVPFAFTAYDVVGEIHPTSIFVGGNKVIDEQGRWVGDSSSIPGIKSITVVAPLTGGTITDTGNIGIPRADGSTDGYLSKDDYAVFIGKQNRVAGFCNAGTCVSKINEDGTVECDICGGGGGSISISGGAGIVVDPNPIVGIGTISIDKMYFDNLYILRGESSSITGSMIADASITKEKIGDSGCADGQVLKYSGGTNSWECAPDNTGSVNITGMNGIVVSPDPITSTGTIFLDSTYQDGSAYDARFVNENQASSISTAMIQSGAVTLDKINQSGCADGEIMKYDFNGGRWICSNDNNSGGTVTSVETGTGLTGGPITTKGKIELASNYADGSAYDSRFVNEGQVNSINNAMISDKTITLGKLNQSGCKNGQVIKYYVEQPGVEYWTCGTDDGITSCNSCDATFVNENQASSISTTMLQDGSVTGLKIADGTITDADLSTGSYTNITGVGTLGTLTVSGNTYLATASGTNVGIGTTSPSEQLHLYKSSAASGYTGIKLTYNFTGPVNGTRSSQWWIYATSEYGSFEIANAGGAKLHIDGETDYIGLGNTSPTQKLDVTGNIRASGQLISDTPYGTSPLKVASTTQVNNLNADMVDSWHAAVYLSGAAENLYGVAGTTWVDLYKWRVDFDSVPGNTLKGLGYIQSSSGSIPGRIRFLVNGTQVGSDCTFTATTTETALDCPTITYTKPSGMGTISIQIRKDNAGAESVYYGENTVVLK